MSLGAWMSEVGHLVLQGRRSYRLTYPAPPPDLRPQECEAAGFEFYNKRSAHGLLDEQGSSLAHIDFSPDLSRYAVSVRGPGDWSGALLWVDGEVVPVPRSEEGDPLCEQLAQWPDDRFVYVEMGGLWNHPLLDPDKIDPLGEFRGLLVWDAVKHVQHVVLPEAEQAWTAPLLVVRKDSWHIYPNGDAFQQNRPDRVMPIPR